MMVDSHHRPVGSYCCCQPDDISGSFRITTAAIMTASATTMSSHPVEAGLECFAVSGATAMGSPPERVQLTCRQGIVSSPEYYAGNFTLARELCGGHSSLLVVMVRTIWASFALVPLSG